MPLPSNRKAVLDSLKMDFSTGATYAKTVVTAVISGSAVAMTQLLATGDREMLLFTHSGLIKLGHTFIAGAVCSIIGLFRSSPLHNTVGVPVNPAAVPPVTPGPQA